MSAPDERLWTTAEVADYYRVRQPTVRAWVKDGKLRVEKRRNGAYLFRRSDVMAFGEARDRDQAPVTASGDVAAIINTELRRVRGA